MTKILPGLGVTLLWVTLMAADVAGQQCYRLSCNQSNQCTAAQAGPSGKCCCTVSCVGGEGGTQCTCSTYCETACGTACPSCTLCSSARLALGEAGFVLTPEAHERTTQQHLLAAQILDNLSGRLAYPVFSGIAAGKSNVNSPYDYSYKARVAVSRNQAVIEIVFEQAEKRETPKPVRLVIDEFGNVSASALTAEEVELLRSATTASCSQVATDGTVPALSLPLTRLGDGELEMLAALSEPRPTRR